MSFVTHSTAALLNPAQRKQSRLMRLVHSIIEARTRMYLAAVTDHATGRIDPDLEQRVVRMMAL